MSARVRSPGLSHRVGIVVESGGYAPAGPGVGGRGRFRENLTVADRGITGNRCEVVCRP